MNEFEEWLELRPNITLENATAEDMLFELAYRGEHLLMYVPSGDENEGVRIVALGNGDLRKKIQTVLDEFSED